MKDHGFKGKRVLTAVLAGAIALGTSLALPKQAEAAPAYNTKYTDTYSMAYLMAPALIKNTDPVGTYLQLRSALRYQTLTQGDIWLLHQSGIEIPAESMKLLYEAGMISGYLYKTVAGLPYTEADVADIYNAAYYASNPAIATGLATGTLTYDELLLNFFSVGMPFGLQGSENFNLDYFKANYPDLVRQMGDDNAAYYAYFMIYGKEKNLVANKLIKKK